MADYIYYTTAYTASTATCTSTTGNAWPTRTTWIGTTTSTATTVWPQWVADRQFVEAAEARGREHFERQRVEALGREALYAAAKIIAKRTLLQFLSPSQRHEYEAGNFFHCRDRRGKRYLIKPLKGDNVIEYNGAVPATTWCLHEPAADLPVEDTMLALKLAIEGGDEEELRTIAHRRPYRIGDVTSRQLELAA